jgi:hypothetical protein
MTIHRDLKGGARPYLDYPPARPMKCAPRATQIAQWTLELERDRRNRRRIAVSVVGLLSTLVAWVML